MEVNYTITNLILDYILKYELSIKNIEKTPLPFKFKDALYSKLRVEDITSLGEMIGEKIGYETAVEIETGKLAGRKKNNLLIFNNYRSTQDFIKTYNQMQFIPPSAQLVTHINKILMQEIVEMWEVGKFRQSSEKPNEIYDSWYRFREHYPNINYERHFNEIFEQITNSKGKVHKLIYFIVLLYEFIEKAPLIAGNQLTAIQIFSILLKEYGYNPDNLLPLNKCMNFLGSDLTSAYLKSKSQKDLTIFIEAILYSLSLEILNLENQITEIYENKVRKKAELSIDFNTRQIKILEYLQVHKKVSRSDYTKIMDVSFMTAYRDLQELLEEEYLKAKGRGRGRYYVLDQDSIEEQNKEIPTFIDLDLKKNS